ncbi:MAG TPA: hypothetical protein VK530_01985, partial [Candidatus Acidoferrum sp.]|nr:hypothetical protein [Candidatus Acidoferrum sp.]
MRTFVLEWFLILSVVQRMAAAEPMLVEDIHPGPPSSSPRSFAEFNGRLLFIAQDAEGSALWSMGSSNQLVRLVPLLSFSPGAVLNGELLFAGFDFTNGTALWKTDGTPTGTRILYRRNYGYGLRPTKFRVIGSNAVFIAGVQHYNELWRTDGTTDGTYRIAEINDEAEYSGPPLATVIFNGFACFSDGGRLWQTDGTTLNTKPFTNGPVFYMHYVCGVIGTNLLFVGSDSSHGWELWRTDGTQAGTTLVKDICAGAGCSG